MEKHWHFTNARYSAAFSSESLTGELDEAFKYLQVAGAGAIYNGDDVINLKKLRRKIDWHIIPILSCCFGVQFLCKTVLNVCTLCNCHNGC